MEKKTKELIKILLNNQNLIPTRYWRGFLWLQNNESLGISRNRRFRWKDKFGSHESNWQNFFRKSKGHWDDHEIRERLQDYFLFLKGDKLTAHDVINCRNAAIRSLLLRQFGYERLIKELNAKIVHQDGSSQLIEIDMGNYEENTQ